MIDSPEILHLIETTPIFRGISRELLDTLLQKANLVTLKPGEKLLSPGVINEHVYLLISGRMSVRTEEQSFNYTQANDGLYGWVGVIGTQRIAPC